MADWIKSLTGKTFRSRLSELRAARQPVPTHDDVVAELDALALQATETIYTMRSQINRLRLATVRARQVVIRLQRLKRPDIEI